MSTDANAFYTELANAFYTELATFLNGSHSSTATTLTVDDTSLFPATGTLKIDTGLAVEETRAYSAKTPTTFTLTSGLANNHADNTAVALTTSQGKGCGDVNNPGAGEKLADAERKDKSNG